MTNLDVDVMEGDRFVAIGGSVFQERGNQDRCIGLRYKGEWANVQWHGELTTLDLPTFTRYCEGCGLTVKMVKPEPQVETIYPPEWGVLFVDGRVELHTTQSAAETWKERSAFIGRVVRIDWGEK